MTVGMDQLNFKHSVQIDTMFLDGKAVCYMVEEATKFAVATFLKDQSTSKIWKAIQNMWSHVFRRPPDSLSVDQGTSYNSTEMRQNFNADGIELIEAPIEHPGSIGTVERYQNPSERHIQNFEPNSERKRATQNAYEWPYMP